MTKTTTSKGLLLLIISLLGVSLFLSVYNIVSRPKIAFVRTEAIVEGYVGMKEARKAYDEKVAGLQKNIDTLKTEYNKKMDEYNIHGSTYDKVTKAEKERELQVLMNNIYGYTQEAEKKMAEENQKLADGALMQINTFVQQYAKDQGYDMVFGADRSGNVMYGKDAKDITSEVLKKLNENYKK